VKIISVSCSEIVSNVTLSILLLSPVTILPYAKDESVTG
jgi:hypothetical protein